MCRVASTVLPANARSPGRARTWTGMQLAAWGINDEGVSTLLVSELVTNSVMHARTSATLTVAVATGMIEIGVADHGPEHSLIPGQRGMDRPGAGRLLREGGRGLVIVQALSDDWGLSTDSSGKQVWLRRPAPAGWPFAGSCGCRRENGSAQLLASGHTVVAIPGPWDGDPLDGMPPL